jgi:LPXTG-site transpeptidase (sortase) family protein
MRKARPRTLRALSKLFLAAGVILLVVGLESVFRHAVNRSPASTPVRGVAGEPESADDAPPDTQKPEPSEFDKYQVAADAPRYIFIPEINVRAMVKPVGVTPDNHVQAPRNIFDVGWFEQSARPGENGASLMAGHVSSWTSPGVFQKLKTLRSGSIVTIERGDGTRVDYSVVKRVLYAANNVDMAAALKPIHSTRPGLNLITCAGKVIKGSNDFDQRIVVFTEQM